MAVEPSFSTTLEASELAESLRNPIGLWVRRMHEIRALPQKAQVLGEEQQSHVLTSQRLEQRIKQGELGYAEMLRRSLELSRGLEKKRQDINEDKMKLEHGRASVTTKNGEIQAIVTRITRITAKFDTNLVKHES
jgi:hypothetical protein